MIRLLDSHLIVETRTTRAVFEGLRLVSIQEAASGEEFIDRDQGQGLPGFELLLQSGKALPLGVHPLASQVHVHLLTDQIAEIALNDWECDLSIRVSEDQASGDILLEPSAWTMQGGVAGLQWNLAGIRPELQLVAPFQQGARARLSHPQLQGKAANWPYDWEAGVLALAGPDSGFTLQAWDEAFIFKGVRVGRAEQPQSIGLITYARGPLEANRCVGNLCWRLSAYRGSWTAPFLRYRDWYWRAYRLEEAARLRPEWVGELRLAVSWCPTVPGLLEALARKVKPGRVFIHLPDWRPYAYDQDYPTYLPNATGAAFIARARQMGFHVAPHTNACQMSPDHPFFFQARDFCTRGPQDLRWGGWSWLPVQGWGAFGPPQSYSQLPGRKDWNILVNVHLAWSPWRRQLTRQVAALIRDHMLDSIFVDVSQFIHNSDNGVLENLTYPQGSLKLIRELVELVPGFCVSGEARNEISTQYLSVAQFHLFNFAHTAAINDQDVSWVTEITEPVNELLFKGLARGIGYHYGAGAGFAQPNRRPMIDATLKQGAIPTLIFHTADPLQELEGEEAQYILERALS